MKRTLLFQRKERFCVFSKRCYFFFVMTFTDADIVDYFFVKLKTKKSYENKDHAFSLHIT